MVTREQFIAAAGAFYDVLTGGRAAGSSGSSGGSGSGSAPRYDTMISRKGGLVQYASETDLEGLRFWQARAAEPASDPRYEEANAKQAKALGYWIAYREAHPDEQWRGERNRVTITAPIPSAKPELYERGHAPRAEPEPDVGWGGTGADLDDGSIPF